MSRQEKLLKRFLNQPKNFTFDETVSLLRMFGFYEVKTGKTSGSRVRFRNDILQKEFRTHRPHPQNIMKQYQLNDIKTLLIDCKLID